MNSNTRLQKLEHRLNANKRCQTCGQPYPPGKFEVKVRFGVYGEPEPKPEYCPECGRQILYVVRWGDD